jgi:hypothetical protein
MPIVTLYGTLHPKHHRLSSPKAFAINWGSNDLGFPLIMEVKIMDSSFEVRCDLPHFKESMISTLYARGLNLVRAYVDSVSFAMGIGFTITVDDLKRPDGSVAKIQRVNEILGSLCTAYKFPPRNAIEQAEFEKVLKLILAEPNLMGSLTDLADTLASHHQTPTNCGRVLDSLRRTVAPDLKDAQGWLILQQLLRISRPFMEFVSIQSTKPRHGDRITAVPEETVTEIARRTWQIVNRFIEFRKRGSQPLSESEFPEL